MSEEKGGISAMIKRGLVTGLGVLVGANLLEGISYDSSGDLVLAVVLLGIMGAVLKPILVLLALPFVVLTLGLGVLVINAVLYLLVGGILDGFEVDSFWAAFFGALWVTFFNVLFSGWINDGGYLQAGKGVRWSMGRGLGGRRTRGPRKSARSDSERPRRVKAKDDVIDI